MGGCTSVRAGAPHRRATLFIVAADAKLRRSTGGPHRRGTWRRGRRVADAAAIKGWEQGRAVWMNLADGGTALTDLLPTPKADGNGGARCATGAMADALPVSSGNSADAEHRTHTRWAVRPAMTVAPSSAARVQDQPTSSKAPCRQGRSAAADAEGAGQR